MPASTALSSPAPVAAVPVRHLTTHIPAAERIPIFQKIMFGTGMNTEAVAIGLMTGGLWMPYFNIGMGLNPVLLGVVLMILRTWEAFADPLLGNLSDNTRTRWGRRRPFMLVGAVLTGCLYPLFWYMPSGWGDHAKAAYLVVVGIVFFTAFCKLGDALLRHAAGVDAKLR